MGWGTSMSKPQGDEMRLHPRCPRCDGTGRTQNARSLVLWFIAICAAVTALVIVVAFGGNSGSWHRTMFLLAIAVSVLALVWERKTPSSVECRFCGGAGVVGMSSNDDYLSLF